MKSTERLPVDPGTALSLAQIRIIHTEVAAGNWAIAGNLIMHALGEEPCITEARDGEKIVRMLLQSMLDAGNHLGASAMCLPPTMFSPEPDAVRRLFKSAAERPMLLSMGASSMSKTYGLVVFCYLEWLRDPMWTAVKLMSQTDGHLRTNVWPHLLEIHAQNVLKPERKVMVRDSDLWMGIEGHPMSYGFSGMAFRQSAISAGAFKGFKPQPKRPVSDPTFEKFGPMTRLRVLIDEAQQIPEAVWTDLNSILASVGQDRVKVMAAFNPENLSQPVVIKAEPEDGWLAEQMETLYSYESKRGWWVERLDGARCENVIERREIYPGLMTYERYLGYLKGGGDNSPAYSTFARGFPPLQESINTVLVPAWVSSQRGEAIYIGPVISVGAFDAAYQGQDRAVLCIGRWGLATGWRDASGKVTTFVNRLNPGRLQPRHVLTIDQFFTTAKGLDPVAINQELMGRCKMLGIEPQWLAMDKTGNALATYSYVDKYWGHVLGIGWNEGATESKILTDDLDTCANRFEGKPSEMWFALKYWLDPTVGALLFNPTVNAPTLYNELTSRRFRISKGNRLKVEGKDEYKARNGGKSPDMADCCIMLVALLRARSGITPGIVEQAGHTKPKFPITKPSRESADGNASENNLELGNDDNRGVLEQEADIGYNGDEL